MYEIPCQNFLTEIKVRKIKLVSEEGGYHVQRKVKREGEEGQILLIVSFKSAEQ
jgi:hypothetical protein